MLLLRIVLVMFTLLKKCTGLKFSLNAAKCHRTGYVRLSMSTLPPGANEIVDSITVKGNQIKALKASKPPTLKDDLVPLVNELLALKQSYKDLTGSEFGGEKEKEKKTGKKEAPVSSNSTKIPSLESTEGGSGLAEIRLVRVKKLNEMRAARVNPFEYTFQQSHKTEELQKLYAQLPPDHEDVNADVAVAGRIMVRRVFGKLAFFELQDDTGTIQLYMDKSRMSESFQSLKDWTDAGDIIGVRGTIKRTEKGELSVYAKEWKMLTKSLLPLPDKWSGLKDTDKRYRQRHLDMIVNPEVRNTFRLRARITSSLRRLLDEKGFLEIETPILNSQPGGAEAKPFETYHNTLDMDLTLRIATELHLKRLIVGGFDRVYEIGRIFRNEGISTRHNPEFTSIELYQAYADFDDMMRLTEELVSKISKEILGTTIVPYGSHMIDLTPPWRRVTMKDLVKETCGVDFSTFMESKDVSGAKAAAIKVGVPANEVSKVESVGEVLNIAFETFCEEKLIQPTFVTEHPIEISPLSKPHRSKADVVERFELFMVGREHANAFSELTDPIDQRERFMKQADKKAKGDEEACGVDEEFLSALETGMPPTAGLGIGIDRLVMVLTNSPAIRDVIAFPLLKKFDLGDA